jgi:hypothetical protein
MHRSAPTAVAVSGALCLAFLLVACGPPASPPSSTGTANGTASATGTATSTSTATASQSATASPTATAPSAAGWKSYTTTDGQLTFDLPSAWVVKDPAGEVAEGGGAFVDVSNPAGKPMATLRTNMATGSTCTQRYPYSVLDTQPLPALAQPGSTPRYIFESRTDTTATDPQKINTFAYGIVTGPEPTGDKGCPIFHFFTWPPNAAMFSGAYNPFDTTPGNEPHVDTPEIYMGTQEYKDIRTMITSLRPAK